MFLESTFNQDVSTWCVPLITSEPEDFATDSPLQSNYKPIWGTCPGKPSSPTLLAPQNFSNDISRILKLQWTSDAFSKHYQLQVFEGTVSIVIDTLVTDTTFINVDPLKSNTEYSWRVRGINGGEPRVSDWSNVLLFTTGVRTSTESNAIPSIYSLNQNYPNPFNPTTTITYSLPQPGMVTLNVYDITGRFITTLVNSAKGAGVHSIEFDASTLSSGMYIYTLQTDGYRQTRQMMLVK